MHSQRPQEVKAQLSHTSWGAREPGGAWGLAGNAKSECVVGVDESGNMLNSAVPGAGEHPLAQRLAAVSSLPNPHTS